MLSNLVGRELLLLSGTTVAEDLHYELFWSSPVQDERWDDDRGEPLKWR